MHQVNKSSQQNGACILYLDCSLRTLIKNNLTLLWCLSNPNFFVFIDRLQYLSSKFCGGKAALQKAFWRWTLNLQDKSENSRIWAAVYKLAIVRKKWNAGYKLAIASKNPEFWGYKITVVRKKVIIVEYKLAITKTQSQLRDINAQFWIFLTILSL